MKAKLLTLALLASLAACGDKAAPAAGAIAPEYTAATASAPVAESQPSRKPRANFGRTVEELAADYNAKMKEVNAKLQLPPNLREPKDNGEWKLYQQLVTETTAITFEAEDLTNKAFSMGLVVGATTKEEVVDAFLAMTMVSATVFGKGENANAISSVCAAALKTSDKHAEKTYAGYTVYCSYLDGAYMAGISVPR